jgi:hypothetical protein
MAGAAGAVFSNTLTKPTVLRMQCEANFKNNLQFKLVIFVVNNFYQKWIGRYNRLTRELISLYIKGKFVSTNSLTRSKGNGY